MPLVLQVQTVRHTLDGTDGSSANMLPLMLLAQQMSAGVGGRASGAETLAPSLLWASVLQTQARTGNARSSADAPGPAPSI